MRYCVSWKTTGYYRKDSLKLSARCPVSGWWPSCYYWVCVFFGTIVFKVSKCSDGQIPNQISCQISNHSVNRFKSFNQISNLKSRFFPQISSLLVTNFKSNLKSLIFVVNSTQFVHWFFTTAKMSSLYSQWSQLISHSELYCMRTYTGRWKI